MGVIPTPSTWSLTMAKKKSLPPRRKDGTFRKRKMR
jgi:hypothetical protein